MFVILYKNIVVEWMCPKCNELKEIYDWRFLEDHDLEVYCCDITHNIEKGKGNVVYSNEISANNAFSNSLIMKLIKNNSSNYSEIDTVYEFETNKIKNCIIGIETECDEMEEYANSNKEVCCCWKLDSWNVSLQKKMIEYCKNGDLIVYKDNSLAVVYKPWRDYFETVKILEEGINLIPSRITELCKNPIYFYKRFINPTSEDEKNIIHAIEIEIESHSKIFRQIINIDSEQFITSGVIYFNLYTTDIYYKAFYHNDKEHIINIWNFL
jgi:hypothetical protein